MRIGIAEDQALVRESLAIVLALEADVEVTWTAANGQEALEKALTAEVDVLLIDLRMPQIDGVSVIKRLKALGYPADALVLTTFHQEEWILEAIGAGAKACFLKEVPPKLLLQAIRQIREGRFEPELWSEQWRLYAPEVQFQIRLSGGGERVKAETLTVRERELLRLLVAGATNAEMGEQLFLTEGTVKNYLSALYAKLGVRNRAEAVRVARERGLS